MIPASDVIRTTNDSARTATVEFDVHAVRNADRSKTKCYHEHVCVDDYGEAWFIGHYSEKLLRASEAVYFGAVVPQAKVSYVDLPEAAALRKLSVRLFDAFEQNCNTCVHLQRIPQQRRHPAAPMHGVCGRDSHAIVFHPEDHMGMNCWEPRK